MDVSQFDEESLFCMLELLMVLLSTDKTVEDFFKKDIINQEVKRNNQKKTMQIINSGKFFDGLRKVGIWKEKGEHEPLKEVLRLDKRYPDLLKVKKITGALEALQANKDFMDEIQHHMEE